MRIGETSPTQILTDSASTTTVVINSPIPHGKSTLQGVSASTCFQKIKNFLYGIFHCLFSILTCCRYVKLSLPISWETLEDHLNAGFEKIQRFKDEKDFAKFAIRIRINKSIYHSITAANFPIDTKAIKEWYLALPEKSREGFLSCFFIPLHADGSVDAVIYNGVDEESSFSGGGRTKKQVLASQEHLRCPINLTEREKIMEGLSYNDNKKLLGELEAKFYVRYGRDAVLEPTKTGDEAKREKIVEGLAYDDNEKLMEQLEAHFFSKPYKKID